jgi:hypothetical protein
VCKLDRLSCDVHFISRPIRGPPRAALSTF